MSKKSLIIILALIIAVGGGFLVWQNQAARAKTERLESEIVKSLTTEEIALVLQSQVGGDSATGSEISQSAESRKIFLNGLKEYLALAAEARREGLTEDTNFKINFEYKKNLLLADLYKIKLNQANGKAETMSPEEIKSVWNSPANEKQFSLDMDTMQAIQKAVFEVRGDYFVPAKLQGESLEKAREKWARTLILSAKAKADQEFMTQPVIGLRIKILEAGILSADYLRKHWIEKIRPTNQEITAFLAAHPEYDLKKKCEKAESVLKRAIAGEDFAELAKEFSEHRPTKKTGGLFENIGKKDLAPEIEATALSLEKGQTTNKLVETELGWNIIKLESKEITKDKNGNETVKYSIRNILFQNRFEEPQVKNPNIPPPFLTAQEIAKAETEKEKRNKFVAEIVAQNRIFLPDDFPEAITGNVKNAELSNQPSVK